MLQRLEKVAVVAEAAEDDDRDLRMLFADEPSRLDSLHLWHLEVHQDQVGSQLIDHAHSFLAVGRLSHYFHARIPIQKRRQARPEKGVVVRDEDRRPPVFRQGRRFFSGKLARTIIPPGPAFIVRRPPRRPARSRMPRTPLPSTRGFVEAIICLPTSPTQTTARGPISSNVIATERPRAWRHVLFSASWMIR